MWNGFRSRKERRMNRWYVFCRAKIKNLDENKKEKIKKGFRFTVYSGKFKNKSEQITQVKLFFSLLLLLLQN